MTEHPVPLRDITPGGAAGIDRALIDQVVRAFYARIRDDAVLGPIFAARIEEARWPVHLDTMVEFWSSVLLLTGSYKGKPVPAHLPLKLRDEHYRHWLTLFDGVVSRLCPAPAAALFMERAARIADSLRMAAALQTGGGAPVLVEPLSRQVRA